jgi:hypothetical protein
VKRIAFWATIAGAVALAACADFSSPADPTGGLPDVLIAHPSLATDLQPLFTARCAQGGCHTPASARAGLVLSTGQSWSHLVNVSSLHGAPMMRVLPGDHTHSYLWAVIQPDDALHPGLPRMPLAAQPLTANQIQNIVNWITDGAPNN